MELEILKKNIKNAKELQSLVKIMKTISAANIREYQLAVESLVEYNKTIEMGFQIIMRNKPKNHTTVKQVDKKKGLGAIIFGSDQGLCGNFNERISGYAREKLKGFNHEELATLAVGERVIPGLKEQGMPVDSYFSFSGSILGITQVMLELLIEIEKWRVEKGISEIILFYNGPISGSSFQPKMVHLYPLDMDWLNWLSKKKWPSRSLPTFSMDFNELFSSLVRQYLFFSLYRAFVESLASENASRLLSMQMAEKNLDEHLTDLNNQFNRQRQTAITSEILDIVTGFEALTGDSN